MKNIYIDTKTVNNVHLLHNYLKQKFDFPDYYGSNLDALYDMLTTIHEETEIYVSDYQNNADPNFNRYMERFFRVLHDSEMENSHLTVIIEKTGI